MSEPVSLDAKRKEKTPRCLLCGQGLHDWIGQCTRIVAITIETDGSETYHLNEIETGPDAA